MHLGSDHPPAGGALEAFGFRVATVPRIRGGSADWAGISYTNAVAIGDTLFLPRLRAEIPSIRVEAIDARYLLLMNGGIHCAMAIGRRAGPR